MLSIIVAIAKNNVIGKDNKLIWHISEDLKRFKSITSGKSMIMGRKTFESLPGILPNREHIILTRDKNFKVDSDKVKVVNDLDTLIEKYSNCEDEVFVIGGAEIYKQLLPYAHKLYLTKIDTDFEGDTYFPQINYDEFKSEFTSEKFTDEKNGLNYTFINLIRK
ncbi:dihydrofolate reductase [Clostridium saccharobutylicum]|uniref:Dihydrofolate reductase n=1 Tax=Clostridium saccharobutylicum DSM 13864 TaxID=1345695 RepID=U5N0N6_CLOSA|nr:dihydrofolate reductase [Clostridium saccharobutylicum]AGX45352.1 dihydrofolate reductase FolA [Clostridium saccharobutylicum DSM 13864]AQR92627.1 dihydrofolate reductase [Clostridium saccharobutylicum]AQS02529.1 dihydrofolate reductase [Clostridium saccharobutylicum]AQS16512.1 dihydrofolate reductase [Clostridium saccharobutylicum]MBA2906776.1 dihydrofolate reductase [Clostridium saccharobutylicum]